MTVNPDLTALLDQKCTLFVATETVVNMRTVTALAATAGISCHVQTLSPIEVAKGFGYEKEGMFQAFFESTQAGIDVGNRLKQTSGPYTNTQWHIRALGDVSDWVGIEHTMALLELTTEST